MTTVHKAGLRVRLAAVGLGQALLAPAAHAHSAASGSNHVLNGLLHPLSTPGHLLLLLSLALMLGQQRGAAARAPLVAFSLSAAGALGITVLSPETVPPAWALSVLTLVCGALGAAAARVPVPLRSLLVALAAGCLGLDSGLEDPSLAVLAKTLLGTWLALVFVAFEGAHYASRLEARWLQIGLRVLSSWTVAIAALMLAFAARSGATLP